MAKYIRRGPVIDAWQMPILRHEIMELCGENDERIGNYILLEVDKEGNITKIKLNPASESKVVVEDNDWVILEPDGELSFCDNKTFQEQYECKESNYVKRLDGQ